MCKMIGKRKRRELQGGKEKLSRLSEFGTFGFLAHINNLEVTPTSDTYVSAYFIYL